MVTRGGSASIQRIDQARLNPLPSRPVGYFSFILSVIVDASTPGEVEAQPGAAVDQRSVPPRRHGPLLNLAREVICNKETDTETIFYVKNCYDLLEKYNFTSSAHKSESQRDACDKSKFTICERRK